MKKKECPDFAGLECLALDVFISHNHADSPAAVRLKRELKRSGFSVWLDVDEITDRDRTLLSDKILKALSRARNIVVLWSRASARSGWVQMEWITIFNLNLLKKTVLKKKIIPCRLDNTPFAPSGASLLDYSCYDLRRWSGAGVRNLVEALSAKPPSSPTIAPHQPPPEVDGIIRSQQSVIEALAAGDVSRGRKLQKTPNAEVARRLKRKPLDRYIQALDGHNKKNEYMIRHWEAVQAGRRPRDPLLRQAEQRFLSVLARYPADPFALSGIGGVLFLQGNLDGAQFYTTHAAALAEDQSGGDSAPEHDPAMISKLQHGSRRLSSRRKTVGSSVIRS